MNIRLNGNEHQCPQGSTLHDLVVALQLDPARVVVEHNRTIIKTAELAATTMNDNDEVELLQFVGGG